MEERSSIVWQSLEIAAKRLCKSRGHLRKLCPTLARDGMARLVNGGGVRPRWEVRSDAPLHPSPVRAGGLPLIIELGGVRIVIDSPCVVRVSAPHDQPGSR